MPPRTPDPEAHLPLTPAVFHILLSLLHEEKHGYAMMQSIADATDGVIRMGPGTLYGTIKRLLASGWIAESGERHDPALDDTRRRYYRLTTTGRRILEAEARRYEGIVRAVRGKGLRMGARSTR